MIGAHGVAVLDRPVTEGERSEPGGAGVTNTAGRPDPGVVATAKRRQFSARYKAQIVREAEACTELGEIGALLRREGLYSSQLSKWRQAIQEGALASLGKSRGRKKDPDTKLRRRVQQLEQENTRLKRQLGQAEKVIEVQKKLSELLEIDLQSDVDDERA